MKTDTDASRYIRLTSDRPSQRGSLFSRMPLSATNWQIEFEFRIHGSGSLYGDGFAMWLTKERAVPGPVFGSADRFEGLAIFFDTYKNNRPGVSFPLVMAMMGDGQTAYDQANDGKSNELASCSVRCLPPEVIFSPLLRENTPGPWTPRRFCSHQSPCHLLPRQITIC